MQPFHPVMGPLTSVRPPGWEVRVWSAPALQVIVCAPVSSAFMALYRCCYYYYYNYCERVPVCDIVTGLLGILLTKLAAMK